MNPGPAPTRTGWEWSPLLCSPCPRHCLQLTVRVGLAALLPGNLAPMLAGWTSCHMASLPLAPKSQTACCQSRALGVLVCSSSLGLSLSSSWIILLLESPLSGDYGEATTKDLLRCSVEKGTEAMCTRAVPCQVPAYRFVAWRHASKQSPGCWDPWEL